MAVIRGIEERQESDKLRPGDAVFDINKKSSPDHPYHVHVAIYAGPSDQAYSGPETLAEVLGLPGGRAPVDREALGVTQWGVARNYKIDDIGQCRSATALQVKKVLFFGEQLLKDLPQLKEQCVWSEARVIRNNHMVAGEVPVLLRGNCAHFVGHLYFYAGLAIVDEQVTFSPADRSDPKYFDWLRPSTQLHAFYTGTYPLRMPWDEKLGKYPDCFFGNRSVTT